MSTVATLPFFLFTFPAGAIADMVDRRRLLCIMNFWLAIIAAGLAALVWLKFVNPYVILAAVFLLGVGFAINAPAWTAIIPEVVTKEELPAAITLGGLQLNILELSGPQSAVCCCLYLEQCRICDQRILFSFRDLGVAQVAETH